MIRRDDEYSTSYYYVKMGIINARSQSDRGCYDTSTNDGKRRNEGNDTNIVTV
jgi:hypothetical protein